MIRQKTYMQQNNTKAILEYIKNKNVNELINKMDEVKINNECMLCKKLKQKLGNYKFGKELKFCKK